MKWEITPLEFQIRSSGLPPGSKLAATLTLRLKAHGPYPLKKGVVESLKQDLAKHHFTFFVSPGKSQKKEDEQSDPVELFPLGLPQVSESEGKKGHLFIMTWELPTEGFDEKKDHVITVNYDDIVLVDLMAAHYINYFLDAIKSEIIESNVQRSFLEQESRRYLCNLEGISPAGSLNDTMCQLIEDFNAYLESNTARNKEIKARLRECKRAQPTVGTILICPPVETVTEESDSSGEVAGLARGKSAGVAEPVVHTPAAQSASTLSGITVPRQEIRQVTEMLDKSLDTIRSTKKLVKGKQAKADPSAIMDNLSTVEAQLKDLKSTLV